MSPPVDRGIGQNPVMCYFPDLPYYLSYQIGFDTVINPLQAQVDPTVAGQPMRLIYVPLYAPGGFTGNAATVGGMPHRATMGGMPHRHSFRSDVPQFFHRRPTFCPSPFSDFSHVTPQFDHHDPMIFGGPVILEEVHHHSHTRTFEYIGNRRPVQIMETDDTINYIRPCNMSHEFHREPDLVHNEPPQRSPKRMHSQKPQKQPRHSHQQPSTSGMTGERDTSCASPSKASGDVATVESQTDKSHAPPRKGSERVATDRKNCLQKKNKTKIAQQMPEEHRHGSPGDVQEIQCTKCTLPVPASVSINIEVLPPDLNGQNNDDNKGQDNEKPNRDPKVDDN